MNSEELKQTAKLLIPMFASFPQSPVVDVDAQAHSYVFALKGYRLEDIEAAVHRFIQGEVPGFNGAFCPSTAQLCAEVRERQKMRELRAKNEAASAKVIPMRPANHWLTRYEAGKSKDGGGVA